MKTKRLAIHGETYGTITMMPDNEEAGYGPSYSTGKDHGYICAVVDSHWPSYYLIRCDSWEEAYEHAEVCLCPVEEELEAEAAKMGDDWDAIQELIDSNDCTYAQDGHIHNASMLRIIPVNAVNGGD